MHRNMYGQAQRAVGMDGEASLVGMGDLHHARKGNQQRAQHCHGHAQTADLPRLGNKTHLPDYNPPPESDLSVLTVTVRIETRPSTPKSLQTHSKSTVKARLRQPFGDCSGTFVLNVMSLY
jgi:hypothetical protein